MTPEQVKELDEMCLFPRSEMDIQLEREAWGTGMEAQRQQDALVAAGVLEAVQ